MGRSYAIIGGGIVGSSIAYHLSERAPDAEITVYEQGRVGGETTRKSMALLGRSGDRMMARMKAYGLELYNGFMADPRAEPFFDHTGSLGVATTQDGRDAFEQSAGETGPDAYDSLTASGKYAPVEFIPPTDLNGALINPFLNTDAITGVLYHPTIGYTRPRALALEFSQRATENGVAIREDTRVEEIHVTGREATGLTTADETIEPDAIVCAAGPWNAPLTRGIELGIPVKHSLAPILKYDPPDPLPFTLPHTKHYETRYYYRGDVDGTVHIGHNPGELGTYEDAPVYDPDDVRDTVPADIREDARAVTEQLYPFLLEAALVDEWVGVRSRTPDRRPIIGWTAVENFSIAAFHSGGIQLAPAAGAIITHQLVDSDPTPYYDTVSITRFDGYADMPTQ